MAGMPLVMFLQRRYATHHKSPAQKLERLQVLAGDDPLEYQPPGSLACCQALEQSVSQSASEVVSQSAIQ